MRTWPKIRVHIPMCNRPFPLATNRAFATASLVNQTLSLRDGRILGYAESGIPAGFPLLYFHGFPGSRYGLSTFQPNRRIMDWPADMQSLVDHLGLSQFAVLGGSGAGAPPWTADMQYISLPMRLLSLTAFKSPAALTAAIDGLVQASRWSVNTGEVTKWLDWIEKQKGEDETFKQGSAAGVQEAVLLSHDWGFRFKDITYDKA
ncbi:hypothetical protein BJX99DRAFT_244081 [Aspergillus californicus]